MELATILSVVQTILTAFQTLDELTAIFTISDYEDVERELGDLLDTVNHVNSVLEDAESRQGALNSQEKNYFEQLKSAIYDTDDVLDEFVTLLKQKQAIEASVVEAELEDLQNTVNNFKSVLEDAECDQSAISSQEMYYVREFDEFLTRIKQEQDDSDDEVLDKVKSFLFGFINYNDYMFDKVKEVNKKFDHIASKSSKFRLKVKAKPIKTINRESSYFVSEKDPIIGRGEDLEKIVDMLLNSGADNQPNNVSSLAIVGIGGLGKTALARLVYHDPRITSAFQLKSWTCISDQDEEQWSLTELLGKVARDLLKDPKSDELTSLERIIDQVQKHLEGKKYLLILDDVWTEKYHRWQDFENHLNVGKSGSCIVVTTRSKKTAQIIGDVRVHELKGLSEDDSWHLFKRMAFRPQQRDNPNEELVKLGKDIVKKCSNVPLAIRVVGSLLHGESKPKWLSFRNKELASISENDDSMNNILRVSYHQLNSSLKTCFAYCSIFPKDFVIKKQMLISLWMAQGYINGEYEGEEYFHILLQRCFFQDIEENYVKDIISFKIHDLLHDFAEQVAGMEVCRLISDSTNRDTKVRHLSLLNGFFPQRVFNKTRIRTCLQINISPKIRSSDQLLASNLIANWSSLRSLDLRFLLAERLPESITELFHLRHLNLTHSERLEVLPNSFTKLVNLQTLALCYCKELEALPKDVYKLVDLSTLNIEGCTKVRHMPPNLNLLTKLHTLGRIVVGGISTHGEGCFTGLEALHDLENLKGFLVIRIDVYNNASYVKEDHGGGDYLISKVQLHKIFIEFTNRASKNIEWEQMLLEEMQPHENIKEILLNGYNSEKMPRWPRRDDNSTLFYFPNLVSLSIIDCGRLQFLPSLEKLPHLKELTLSGLLSVEYIINVNVEECSLSEGSSLFPCLERFNINELPSLKGWWSGSGERNEQIIGEEPVPCFGKLKILRVTGCLMLKSIPICGGLENIYLDDDHGQMELKPDKLPSTYKWLLPMEGQSRMIHISYLLHTFSFYVLRRS